MATGDSVSLFKKGDRVVGTFFPHWFGGARDAAAGRGTYGTQADGWLTSYKVVDEESLVSVPDYLSWEQAATLPSPSALFRNWLQRAELQLSNG